MKKNHHLTLDEIGLLYAYDFGKGKYYTGGDKTSLGHHFTKTYERLFNSMKGDDINLLELGIFHGKSLAMWSDYFPYGMIYGIDISLKPFYENEQELRKHSAFTNNNIIVIEQNITSNSFYTTVNELPNFDIIIDDALHRADAQYSNLKLLFQKLNKGGYYIIEDIVDPIKHIEFFKNIYMCTTNCESTEVKKSQDYSISNKIESIEIRQNMVIIKKK